MESGILNIYKPVGMTSFDVVYIIRKLTGMKKVGHTGTLDPGAEGVLVICAGEALKCVEYMTDKDKEYIARITFGTQTDTQDSAGNTVNSSDKRVTPEELKEVVNTFQGKQKQLPPMYSALKCNGKKYCDIARKGLKIERELQERDIEIYDIYVKDADLNSENFVESAEIFIHCSKGTYIRTICNDIGVKAGTFAHMSRLKRTRAGQFKIEDSFYIEDLKNMSEKGELGRAFINKDYAFNDCVRYTFNDDNIKKITNGISINIVQAGLDGTLNLDEYIRIYDENNNIRAVGKIIEKDNERLVKGYRIFNESDQ